MWGVIAKENIKNSKNISKKSRNQYEKMKKVILLIFLILIVGCKSKAPLTVEPIYEISVKVVNEKEISVQANYSFEEFNNFSKRFDQLRFGTIEGIFTIIYDKAKKGHIYRIVFWDEEHYKQKVIINQAPMDYQNILKLNQENKEATINISISGKLEVDRDNYVVLTVTPEDGMIKEPAICFEHSIRIIDVFPANDFLLCNAWLNFSYYEHNGSVMPLPAGNFMCFDDKHIGSCSSVKGTQCFPPKMEIPKRLLRKVSKCFELGKSINNQTDYGFYVRTMPFFKSGDFLEVYILDKELDINNNYVVEQDKYDIGISDYSKRWSWKDIS